MVVNYKTTTTYDNDNYIDKCQDCLDENLKVGIEVLQEEFREHKNLEACKSYTLVELLIKMLNTCRDYRGEKLLDLKNLLVSTGNNVPTTEDCHKATDKNLQDRLVRIHNYLFTIIYKLEKESLNEVISLLQEELGEYRQIEDCKNFSTAKVLTAMFNISREYFDDDPLFLSIVITDAYHNGTFAESVYKKIYEDLVLYEINYDVMTETFKYLEEKLKSAVKQIQEEMGKCEHFQECASYPMAKTLTNVVNMCRQYCGYKPLLLENVIVDTY